MRDIFENSQEKYITVPEIDYKHLESDLEYLREENEKLTKLLDEKENLIVVRDYFRFKLNAFDRVLGKRNKCETIKQEDFIKKITEDVEKGIKEARKLIDKYNQIPKWIRNIFVK